MSDLPLAPTNLGLSGQGVQIGLIDTGVDSRHPDLAGKITGNYVANIRGEDSFVEEVAYGEDHNSHGTACADIISRIAPAAEIHSVQIIGHTQRDHPDKLIAGLAFAFERGWSVINISAGVERPHKMLRTLVDQACTAGTILIAAKDNRSDQIGYPAAYPGVIAVDMEHFASPLEWRYFPGAEIEVEANGIYIDAAATGGGRFNYTGTSFAAPHIAGIAARWKEANPQGEIVEFRDFLGT